MARLVNDLVNKRFGKLIALELLEEVNYNRTRMWRCICDCGREVKRASTKLKNKEIHSCGCVAHLRNATTTAGESGLNSLYSSYRSAANRRNLLFNIDKAKFKSLTKANCYYCGISPEKVQYGSRNAKRGFGAYQYNGIDRVDNTLGYIEGNIVTCCSICNLAKHNHTSEEFANWMARMIRYQISTNGLEMYLASPELPGTHVKD